LLHLRCAKIWLRWLQSMAHQSGGPMDGLLSGCDLGTGLLELSIDDELLKKACLDLPEVCVADECGSWWREAVEELWIV